MRQLDAEEILPLTWTGRPEDVAAGIVGAGGLQFVALCDGAPVATWGTFERLPALWSVWMFATDRWPLVALSVTRHIRFMLPAVFEDVGAARADCWSMDGHDVAHRWLEMLGARREATVEDYGRPRKKYHCYSWTRSQNERDSPDVHLLAAEHAAPASSPGGTAPGADA